jgi:hypothetical protein
MQGHSFTELGEMKIEIERGILLPNVHFFFGGGGGGFLKKVN